VCSFSKLFLTLLPARCNLQGIREHGVLHKDTLAAGGAADGQAGAGAPELRPCAEAR